MKRVIVASIGVFAFGLTTSNAADIRARPAPYAPPPPVYAPASFSWTGFYLGGNIGGAWAHRDVTGTFFGTNVNNGNGVFIGGGQVGYNWQVGYAVLGVEADFDGVANNNNTGTVFIPALGPIQVTSNDRWITTVAARFGLTNGYWLFYGKAGGGWVGNEDFTVTNLRTGSSFSISNDNFHGGWLVGAGIEWAFAPNWSAKVEYNYLGLEDRTFTVPAGSPFFPGDTFTRGDRNIQMVKAGINYRFNWGGIAEDRVKLRYLGADTRLGNAASDTIRTREERKAKAPADAEARTKAEQAAAAKAEEERKAKAAAEAEAKRKAEELGNRGLAYLNNGDNDRAIADFNEAIRLDPKRAVPFGDRGLAYMRKGDNDRAIADFNEAIRLDPKNAFAFSNRGLAYLNNGDNDRAIADFNEAIRLDPKRAVPFGDRGVAYDKKGDTNRAMADFNEAIRLNPNFALAFCNRGKVKRRINDASGGNADIAKAKQLDASICR